MKKLWLLLLVLGLLIPSAVFCGLNSTVTRGKTFTSTELITHTKLHQLVDDADVTGLKLGAFGSTIRPITISATAPTSPSEGNFWYDTASVLLKQYRSSVWVIIPNIVYLGAESTDPDTVAGKGILYQKDIYDSAIGDTIPTLYFRPDGAGTAIKIAPYNNVYINAKDYGATGNGSTDDTVALQAFLDAIPINGMGIIPEGEYKITDCLNVDTRTYIAIKFIGYIKAYGCSGMKIWNSQYCKIENLRIDLSAIDWTSDFSGLEVYESRNMDIDILRIFGFQKGLTLSADNAGTGYNKFTFNILYDNKYGNYYDISGTGWINENIFTGGRFTLDSATYADTSLGGDWGIYVNSTSSHTNGENRYYSPCFESLHNGILFDDSRYWMIVHPRFESVEANHLSGIVWYGVFIFSYEFDTSLWGLDVSQGGRYNVYIGKEKNNNVTVTVDDQGGIGFMNSTDNTIEGRLTYLVAASGIAGVDNAGQTTFLNKGYEDSTAPDSADDGTYRTSAVIWNTIPTSGQPMGWVCSVSGTVGTLTGITATGVDTELHVHVNSTTGLYSDARIMIAGIGSSYVITGIVGTTVYLSDALTTTVTNAAVSYKTPTFIPMPNFP